MPAEGETITDIQNYLASFNKEIQDNGGQEVVASATSTTTAAATAARVAQPAATAQAGETTFYVTEGSQIAGFQTFEQTQGQFDGGTYYTPQFYSNQTQEFTALPSYAGDAPAAAEAEGQSEALLQAGVTLVPVTEAGSATTSDSGTVQQVAVSLAGDGAQDGLQHIVLAATSEGQETTDGEATEISVTIPASLASQAATEQLLQAVEAQTSEPEQPTFVAMQPDGQQVVAVGSEEEQQQVVAVTDASPGIAALISQAEAAVHQAQQNESQVSGQPQSVRLVVQGDDQQEEIVSGATTGGATIVTSDGHQIQVSEESTLQMVASLAEQAAHGSADGNNQVILNAGNSYQTVTIVPSDSNPGEVSYVLIVSQPEEGKDVDQKGGVNLDMSVYDFNEGEQHAQVEDDEGQVTPKARIVKVSPKKSQAVSQAHMCNYCNYTSPKRYLLSRHMKSHSEERPHKCSVCERGFKTLASLQNHVNTHTGTRPHQCKECESAFTTSGELVRHVRYKHTHEKPHKCTECDYASVELSKLKRHMRCHTGERPYQCPHCTYASPDTYKLKRHLRIHTGEKPYECDVCHARFTQSNSLKAHKLIHSGNKPIFQCELCPTTCGRKTDLRIHVQKLHTSDKPLKCRRCGKSFPDRYTYKVHVKTHEGEKCFKCDLCPYASISQRHLESHMLIHTDQKPYQCEQCDQAFRQKQLLKRHKNLYHDPDYVPPLPKEKTHECSECGRAFRHKGNLIRHMAIHDPEASAQEKAAALRMGRRKKIGSNGEELSDDETDDEFEEDDEDDDLDDDGMTLQGNELTEGQQVVVLEVIQVPGPEGEQQAVAIVSGNAMDMGPTIQAAIAADESLRKSGRRSRVSISEDLTDDTNILKPILVKRGRGRPRRTPLPTEQIQIIEAVTVEKVGDGEMDDNEEVANDAEATVVRSVRGRKRKVDDDDDHGASSNPPSPTKRMSRGKHLIGRGRRSKANSDDDLENQLPDEEEIARREAEAAKRRLEQKQKDMDECFGFKDDEDDEEEESSMNISSQNDSAAETAMQLLAAMQQVEGNLQQ